MKKFDVENWLETSGKKRPYKVPEGYFESVQEKMVRQSRPAPALWVRLRPMVAMAASFVLLVALGGLFLKTVTPAQVEYEEDDYYAYYCEIIPRSDSDALYFAQAEEVDLSEEEIAAFLSESEANIEEYYMFIDEEVPLN